MDGKRVYWVFLKREDLVTLAIQVGGYGHWWGLKRVIDLVCFLFSNPIPRFLPSEPLGKQEICKNVAWSTYCEP